jgi:outer membrane protein assembly factor BamB
LADAVREPQDIDARAVPDGSGAAPNPEERETDMRMMRLAVILGLIGALAACEREFILEGERVDLRAPFGATAPEAPGARAISLPAQSANSEWSHRLGAPSARPQHPAFSAEPRLAWSTPIGQGDGRRHRLATDPVVADGRIFTLDARARVQATSVEGAALWARDLQPDWISADTASGGGLAAAGGRLYVASAYGFVTALDAASGETIWSQRFDAPMTGAPLVQGDRLFISGADSMVWAIDISNGRVDWSFAGTRSNTAMARGPAPAQAGDLVLFPTMAGELMAAERATGRIAWTTAIAGRRTGAAYAEISAITGDPVVDGRRVLVGNQSGRVMALDTASGARLWSAREAAYGPVWPVGGSVFLISDENRLVRLDGATGDTIWARDLPLNVTDRPRRVLRIHAQHGPVLAGGLLWVASSDGPLTGFDPASGETRVTLDVPRGAASAPVVAGRTMYVLGRTGVLHAFR